MEEHRDISPLDRARDALLRLQVEMTTRPSGKSRLALVGVGSLLALTIQVKGAGAYAPTPDMWASSGGCVANCGCCVSGCSH